MEAIQESLAPRLRFFDAKPVSGDVAAEVRAGLEASPRQIAPKFFYDERGSQLFEAITELPEYYPTRTEIGILLQHADAIAALIGPDATIVEFGSGASRKIRLLLERIRPAIYAPLDISRDFLVQSARQIADDYDWLDVFAVCVDYTTPDWQLPDSLPESSRVGFFPGSSIGNFDPAGAEAFLASARRALGPGSGLLLGIDRKKDPAILDAAYNDSAGVTAEFNRNLLRHLNRLLDGDFDPDAFRHVAFYDAGLGRIEMHLESERAQTVAVAGATFEIAAGERIHTENSWKFDIADLERMSAAAGYTVREVWTDPDELFSLAYLAAGGA